MPNPAGVQPPANGQPPSQSAQPDTNRTVASIMEKLKLTAEQKTRIEALRAEATTRMSAIQHDPKLSEEGKHLRTRKLWWEYTVKFRQVLTPEQQRLAMQELTNSGIHLPSETPAAPPKSDLHVSADQDRKLSQLQDDLQAKINAIQKNSKLSDDEKRQQIRQVCNENQAQLRQILTSEQKQQLKMH